MLQVVAEEEFVIDETLKHYYGHKRHCRCMSGSKASSDIWYSLKRGNDPK